VCELCLTKPVGIDVHSVVRVSRGLLGEPASFLYVLGRARNGAPDSSRAAVVKAPADVEGLSARPEAERTIWDEAVRFYAQGPSRRDAIFDDDLVKTTRLLAELGDDADPATLAIEPALAATLNRAAPVYRSVWWPRHRRADDARRGELQQLVDRHGATLVKRLTAVYSLAWPSSPRVVDLCAYANWSGAYSTNGSLIVVASMDEQIAGLHGLEMLLHESSHQWDDEIDERLRVIAAKQNKRMPGQLSHALIFYTTGELVKEVFPDHVPYAVKYGLWERGGFRGMKPLLDQYWRPYLRGSGTFEDAATKLVEAQ
jgi:hypothetical protein